MKVAAIQPDTAWEAPESNFAELAPMIAQAAERGARLVLLPELFATGFSMAVERIAEHEEGPTVAFLKAQANLYGVSIGGSCPISDGTSSRPFNRFVIVSPSGEKVHYDKIHPFGFGGESDHYGRGSKCLTIEIDGIRCSLFVCYDLRFADRFWEVAKDTDCFLVVANWPATRQAHWRTLLQARAIENLAYVVGVNRVGIGDGIAYRGGSLIVDPFGEIVAEAGEEVEILIGEVTRACVETIRTTYPFLADR